MSGNQDVSPLPCPEALKKDTIVYDLVYNPKVTGLLQSAARQGCRTINGFGMLIQQGSLAFQLWTGKPFPTEAVKRYFQENSFF